MTISDWRLPQKAAWWDKLVRFLPWVLALGMAAKAVRHVYEPLLKPLFLGEYVGDLWIYTAAQNQLNWFTTGLMRRELYNTFVGLAGLMGADAMISNAVVFLIFYFMLAAALIWAVARRKGSVHLIALAAMSVVIFYRLSFDVGRSDVAVMLCGLLAAWAARSGRWAVSAAAVSIALAIHETGMIFLAPVVCAIVWEKQAWRDIDWRSIGAAAAVMAVGLGFYVLCSRAQVDVHAAAMHVHTQFAHFEALNWADLASYFNLISFRTIETTWCEIPKNPKYGLQVLAGVFLLTLLSVTLRPKRWRVTLICVLIPFLFISAVATDVGRWAVLGVASILILALTQPQEEDHFSWIFTAIALLAFPLMTKGLGSGGGEASPIPRINYLQRYPAFYTPPADILLDICDPGWKDLLNLPKDDAPRSGMAPFIKGH